MLNFQLNNPAETEECIKCLILFLMFVVKATASPTADKIKTFKEF
jgi:hypothetical protein